MCKLADNETARKYDELQRSVDWSVVADNKRVLQEMIDLLSNNYSEVIFDYGVRLSTGVPIREYAFERIDSLKKRLDTLNRNFK